MKVIHYLIGTILMLAGLAAGLYVLNIAFAGEQPYIQLLDQAYAWRLYVILGSAGLLVSLVLFIVSGLCFGERVQYLAYDVEGGTISISLKAIENSLARLSDEFASIVSLSPTLRAIEGNVDVQLDVKIKTGVQIPELCRMLQDRARSTIIDRCGISGIKEVRVRVQEIVGNTLDTANGELPRR